MDVYAVTWRITGEIEVFGDPFSPAPPLKTPLRPTWTKTTRRAIAMTTRSAN